MKKFNKFINLIKFNKLITTIVILLLILLIIPGIPWFIYYENNKDIDVVKEIPIHLEFNIEEDREIIKLRVHFKEESYDEENFIGFVLFIKNNLPYRHWDILRLNSDFVRLIKSFYAFRNNLSINDQINAVHNKALYSSNNNKRFILMYKNKKPNIDQVDINQDYMNGIIMHSATFRDENKEIAADADTDTNNKTYSFRFVILTQKVFKHSEYKFLSNGFSKMVNHFVKYYNKDEIVELY